MLDLFRRTNAQTECSHAVLSRKPYANPAGAEEAPIAGLGLHRRGLGRKGAGRLGWLRATPAGRLEQHGQRLLDETIAQHPSDQADPHCDDAERDIGWR